LRARFARRRTSSAERGVRVLGQHSELQRHYVLLHGGAHGGWCWDFVAANLRRHGQRVTAPTLPGLGAGDVRAGDHTVTSHAEYVIDLLITGDFRNVTLVGHSYGGSVATVVADRARDRLSALVYVDALIARDGECLYDVLPPDIAAARRQQSTSSDDPQWAQPEPTRFGVPVEHPLYSWVWERLTPHPESTYRVPVRLKHPPGDGLPVTYVECTNPALEVVAPTREWARAQTSWSWRSIGTGHDAMITAPNELSQLLLDTGSFELADRNSFSSQ
jgi:pimeloyl-ACP methyl ester carboxylesterase